MGRNNVLNLDFSDEDSAFVSATVELDNHPSKEIGLIVALVLSLGLWALIWLALASLFGSRPI